jgi:hypothetical protein
VLKFEKKKIIIIIVIIIRGMHWIDLAKDRDMRWALVNPVMNLQAP